MSSFLESPPSKHRKYLGSGHRCWPAMPCSRPAAQGRRSTLTGFAMCDAVARPRPTMRLITDEARKVRHADLATTPTAGRFDHLARHEV